MTYTQCQRLLGVETGEEPQFPMLVRVAELLEYIGRDHSKESDPPPVADDSPAWLSWYRGAKGGDLHWGLDRDFFRGKLDAGACLVLLDGLDEAASQGEREAVSRLVRQAARVYGKCRFVVTSRPQAYWGEAVLAEFEQVKIGDLEWEAVETFLGKWCGALFAESESEAARHRKDLVATE